MVLDMMEQGFSDFSSRNEIYRLVLTHNDTFWKYVGSVTIIYNAANNGCLRQFTDAIYRYLSHEGCHLHILKIFWFNMIKKTLHQMKNQWLLVWKIYLSLQRTKKSTEKQSVIKLMAEGPMFEDLQDSTASFGDILCRLNTAPDTS